VGDALFDLGGTEFPATGVSSVHAPAWLNAVAVTNGFLPPALDSGFAYADFAPADGLRVAALAAANPDGRFFALEGGAAARELAQKAGLANLSFLSGTLADLPEDALPPLDFAAFDGGLATLGEKSREAALARIARAVKPGGILLLGYHALPGFAAMMPLRDVLNSLTAAKAGKPAARLREALDWLDRADAAGIGFLAEHAGVRRRIADLAALPPAAAAAELFSPTLIPFHFAQVEGSLAPLGFTFAGNACFRLNMLDLALPPAAQPLLKHVRSRREFETLRDVLRNRFYRRDVYVRGAAVADEAAFWAQHDALAVGLVEDAEETEIDGAAVDFRGFPFAQLRAALAAGPRRIGDIPGLIPEIARNAVRAALAAGLVVPFAHAGEAPVPGGDALRLPNAFNRAAMAEALAQPGPVPTAAPAAGLALSLDRTEALVLSAIAETGCGFAAAEDAVLDRLLAHAGGPAQPPEAVAAMRAAVRNGLARLTPQRLLALARLGVVAG
jgi:SAM-dependent methyltransferase